MGWFVFRDSLWLRTMVSTFGKALRMQECAIVLGSCSVWESREKSGSTVRLAVKG